MAIMIPDQPPDDSHEKTVFKNLRHAGQARNWEVFHSIRVPNSRDSTRPRQIDFVILIPRPYFTVICLEVKGGYYGIKEDGKWYRRGSAIPERRSPLDQSESAMYALRNSRKFKSYFLSSLSLGCAVAFTSASGIEPMGANLPTHVAEVIFSNDVGDPDRLCYKLRDYADRLSAGTRPKRGRAVSSAERRWKELRRALEPTPMTIATQPRTIFGYDLKTRLPQLLDLTSQQLSSLKLVERNDRCVIDGAAGTGKTVLAMELARQRCDAGDTVAFLCSNPYLSHRFVRWAETLRGNNGGKVVAGTPVTLPPYTFRRDRDRGDGSILAVCKRLMKPLDFIKERALKNKHQRGLDDLPKLEEWLKRGDNLDDKWSSFISKTIKDMRKGGTFDYLIVDEAQNLCDKVFLNLMDALLKGGLAGGHWAMFGDFTNQKIVSPHLTEDGKKALENFGLNWANDVLETNCRNTHEISDEIDRLIEDIESLPMSGVHGPLVQIEYFKSPADLERLLDDLIKDLRRRSFRSQQMILLSSGSGNEFNTERQYGGWQLLNIADAKEAKILENPEGVLVPDSPDSEDTIRYSDVYDFQGLESEVVILVLPVLTKVVKGRPVAAHYEHRQRILYTGMSRAKAMLIIVAEEPHKDFLEPSGL